MNKIGQIYLRTNKVFGAFFSAPIDAHYPKSESEQASEFLTYPFFNTLFLELNERRKKHEETKDEKENDDGNEKSSTRTRSNSNNSSNNIHRFNNKLMEARALIIVSFDACVSFFDKKFNSAFMYGDLVFFFFSFHTLKGKSCASSTCKCNQSVGFFFLANCLSLF